jgi:hypothetical protein
MVLPFWELILPDIFLLDRLIPSDAVLTKQMEEYKNLGF